jgi:hypothetical protein
LEKLYNEELHNLCPSSNIIRIIKSRRMRWVRHVARKGGGTIDAYRIVVGKPEGKRPLGRPRRSLVDNIKRDIREIEWDGIDWIDLAQNRTSGGLLRRRQLTFGFLKMLGSS